jgi:two-component system, OmpR family, sensor kinase
MKHRTFLTTLVLFLIFLNLGVVLITVTTLRDTTDRARKQSMGEHYFIASALVKDFHAVESRGVEIDGSLGSLLQPYSYLSDNKAARLALYKNGQLVYSNRLEIAMERRFEEPPSNGSRLISIQKASGSTYTLVSGRLPAPYDAYTVVYLSDITDNLQTWRHMKNMLFLAALVLSVMLAVCLLLLLNRIFKPLSQISQISLNIAAGAYETRLPVSGHDELSEMARSFNQMAAEIQRQMEELTAAAEKKQQFIDNFAHELRTPLTAIYGFAEYLQKAALTEDDRLAATQYIMTESRRMQTMAYQLLELGILHNGQITWEPVKISSLFQAVQQTLYNKLMEKDLRIEFIHEADTLTGDSGLLESLLTNLTDNAIKACETGGHVVVHAGIEEGCPVITVQDNGKGMAPEVLSFITEPFYRAEKSRSRKDGGAGLGLAICKQITAGHGATLQFTSAPGKGTTAKITFTTS